MSSSAGATRVLFVGNSYTARHDLPAMIVQLAAAAAPPQPLQAQVITAGGASLRRHWNAATVHAALRESRWTYVVLQEQSTLPVKNPVRYRENVAQFMPLLREHGTTPVLYLTWARRDMPQQQDALTDSVARVAQESGARVVPAGLAWQQASRECPDIELYMRDGSHPTTAGAYLTACVFLATLFRVTLATLPSFPPRDLDPLVARRLQAIAQRFADWAVPGTTR